MLWKSHRSDSATVQSITGFTQYPLTVFQFVSARMFLNIKSVGPHVTWQDPAAAAKSLQSCLALGDPIDGSLPGQHIKVFLDSAFHWNNSVLVSQLLLPGHFQSRFLLGPWSWKLGTSKSFLGEWANETISISGRNTLMRVQTTTGRREACITH